MPDAITDTGPVRHLHEIDCLSSLRIFEELEAPALVAEELAGFGVDLSSLFAGDYPRVLVSPVETELWERLLTDGDPIVQPADAQVLALARRTGFRVPVLIAPPSRQARPLPYCSLLQAPRRRSGSLFFPHLHDSILVIPRCARALTASARGSHALSPEGSSRRR